MTLYFYETKIGMIGIAENNGSITNVYFKKDEIPKNVQISETPLLKEAAEQLNKYLAGEIKSFDLPLDAAGTPFMKQVWHCLTEIPYGETSSYREIAEKIENEKAYRAVGLANNKNPIPIFIPCHRVVGADGALTGYRGGLTVKKMLLDLEKAK